MREIVLDTETTGLDARGGDRLIELGCVEIFNRMPTGREFHAFIHPEGRPVHPDALNIHGISDEFLKDKPPFRVVADDFLKFIGDAPLVIHNASFDAGFINMELKRIGRPELPTHRLVDTLMLARRKHPGGPNTLDALCKRYGIDSSNRTKHGALVDSLLLALVYVELLGERQATLGLAVDANAKSTISGVQKRIALVRPEPLPSRLTPELEAAHKAFVETLGASAIWKKFDPPAETPVAADGAPKTS